MSWPPAGRKKHTSDTERDRSVLEGDAFVSQRSEFDSKEEKGNVQGLRFLKPIVRSRKRCFYSLILM